VIRPALARAAEHQLDGVEASDAALGVGIAKRRIRGDEVVAGAGRLLVRLADVDRGGPARDQLDRGKLFQRGQPRRTVEQGTHSQRSPAIAAARGVWCEPHERLLGASEPWATPSVRQPEFSKRSRNAAAEYRQRLWQSQLPRLDLSQSRRYPRRAHTRRVESVPRLATIDGGSASPLPLSTSEQASAP
jgi:hypothetical protein